MYTKERGETICCTKFPVYLHYISAVCARWDKNLKLLANGIGFTTLYPFAIPPTSKKTWAYKSPTQLRRDICRFFFTGELTGFPFQSSMLGSKHFHSLPSHCTRLHRNCRSKPLWEWKEWSALFRLRGIPSKRKKKKQLMWVNFVVKHTHGSLCPNSYISFSSFLIACITLSAGIAFHCIHRGYSDKERSAMQIYH